MTPDGYMVRTFCQYLDPALRGRSVQGVENGYSWVSPGQGTPVDPTESITAEARRRLAGLSPEVRQWPEGRWVVNVPTRFHVANYATVGPITASAPGVEATAEATPSRVEYRFHDGSTVTCPFAGKVFAGGDDNAADACKKSFHQSTTGRAVSGMAEIVYEVDWWSSIDPTRRRLGEMRSAPTTLTYEVRGYEAVGR